MSIWDLMFGGQQLVGILVNMLIFGLFAAGCVNLWRGYLKLAKESALIKGARAKLRGSGENGQEITIPSHSPEAVAEFLSIPDSSTRRAPPGAAAACQ